MTNLGIISAFKKQSKEEELQRRLRYCGLKSKHKAAYFCALPRNSYVAT